MPKVAGVEYPYTPEGLQAAANAQAQLERAARAPVTLEAEPRVRYGDLVRKAARAGALGGAVAGSAANHASPSHDVLLPDRPDSGPYSYKKTTMPGSEAPATFRGADTFDRLVSRAAAGDKLASSALREAAEAAAQGRPQTLMVGPDELATAAHLGNVIDRPSVRPLPWAPRDPSSPVTVRAAAPDEWYPVNRLGVWGEKPSPSAEKAIDRARHIQSILPSGREVAGTPLRQGYLQHVEAGGRVLPSAPSSSQRALRSLKGALNPVSILTDAALGSLAGAASAAAGYRSAAPRSAGRFTPPGPGYEGVTSQADILAIAERKELEREARRRRYIEDVRAAGFQVPDDARIEDLAEFLGPIR